jgi:tetratricopeptide (TPR) repeat protein
VSVSEKKVTSIVAKIEQRQLERARALAERSHRRELEAMVESAELMRLLDQTDFDADIATLLEDGSDEALDAAAKLRCARALLTAVRGDDAAALAEWEAVAKEHPALTTPVTTRARWRLETKHAPNDALIDLDGAAAIDPNEANVYFWRARCYDALEEPERALANYRRAAALSPKGVDIVHGLAKALAAHGTAEEALVAWNRLIAAAPDYADFHHGRACVHEKLGDFDAALADYDRVLALDPNAHGWRFCRAMCLANSGPARSVEALEIVEGLANEHPEVDLYASTLAEMLGARANVRREAGEHEAALGDYDRAIALAPKSDEHRINRLSLRMAMVPGEEGRDEITGEIERLAGMFPDNEALVSMKEMLVGMRCLNRATALAREDKAQEAFDAATEAIEHAPDLVGAWVARAIYRTHLEDEPEGPLADFDHAVEIAPDDLNARFQRAEYLAELGELARAYEDYDNAIRIAPTIGRIYFERACTRARLDERPDGWEQASLDDLEMATKLGFDDDAVFVEKALVFQESGDMKTALATFDEGAKAFPESGFILLARAQLKKQLGDAKGAKADTARAKELGMQVGDDD